MTIFERYVRNRLFKGDYERMVANNKIPHPKNSLIRMKELGFKPNSIFDIGAYEGEFTEMCLEIWPEARVYAFEALSEKITGLKSRFAGKQVRIVEGIVGETSKDEVLFYGDETASSVLQSVEVATIKTPRSQRMFTLAQYLSECAIPAPDFLKIDTQGYEYEILKGMGGELKNVKALLLELNFLEVYDNVHLANELIGFLSENGFLIYDICEIHRRPLDLALFQTDYIFVKRDSPLRANKKWG